MKLTILFGLCLIALSGCAGKQLATKNEGLPFVGTTKVNRYVLKNGLKLLVIEDDTSPTFAYYTWVDVGSRDEEKGQTGIAHLFEHLLGRKTKKLKDQEFDELIDRAGAREKNAATSNDYTVYHQELPKDKLDLVAELEAERFQNIILDQTVLDSEREVVRSERKFRVDNNPMGKMFQELFEVTFKTHPYGRPIIGYKEDLDGLQVTDLTRFYGTFYSPSNATIVIVGDVDPWDAYKTIEGKYGSMPKKEQPKLDIPEEPQQTAKRRKTMKLQLEVEELIMAFKIPPFTHEDSAALELIQGILTTGRSSRLQRALVDKGIASSVSSGSFHPKDPGIFVITATLQKGKKARLAEAIIMRELNRIIKTKISQKELEKAINQTMFDFYSGLADNSAKAEFLGRYETIAGDFRVGTRLYEGLDKVTADQIKATAKKYFVSKNSSVLIGVPTR